LFEFVGTAHTEHVEFGFKFIVFIVVFNVNNLLNLLRGGTTELNQLFSQ
jgi:hypothetical protein